MQVRARAERRQRLPSHAVRDTAGTCDTAVRAEPAIGHSALEKWDHDARDGWQMIPHTKIGRADARPVAA